MSGLLADIRYALRTLRRQPGFVIAAVLTLALGVGANVVLFSAADLAVFRAFPFPEADRLVLARTTFGPDHAHNIWTSSWPDYQDYRDQAESFESLVAVAPMGLEMTLVAGDEPARITVGWVSAGYFNALGTPMTLGREFLVEEDRPGATPVLVLSHEFWRSRFGADREVIGSTVRLDGEPRQVVGVAAPGFRFIVDADAWAPVAQAGWGMARQSPNWLLLGRLTDGVTVGQAQAEVDLIARSLAAEYPETNRDKGLLVTGLQEAVVAGLGPVLFGLWGAVALVLLIACANVTGLLLARGATRRRELAARAALGAARGRLVRQLLVEHTVLGLAASALGTVLALAVQRTMVMATPLNLLNIQPGVHGSALGFATALAVGVTVLSGLPPALTASRVDAIADLKTGTRAAGTGPRMLQAGLVVAQVAFTLVVLATAAMLVRNVAGIRDADPGFAPENLLAVEVGLPRDLYPDGEARVAFFERLVSEVRALPGVTGVGLVSRVPIRDSGDAVGVWATGQPPAVPADVPYAFQRVVMPGYFGAMGIPLVEGRDVRARDDPDAERVVVVSRRLADELFPAGDAVGRTMEVDLAGDTMEARVVAVVGDVRMSSLVGESDRAVYFPYHQRPFRTMGLVVRTKKRPEALSAPVTRVVRSLDPDVVPGRVATMDRVLTGSIGLARTMTGFLVVFGTVAVLLAAVGVYGLLAYQVARRRHELGIRMALGAAAADVLRLVVWRGFSLVGLGLVLGGAGLAVILAAIPIPFVPVTAADPTVGFRPHTDPAALLAVVALLVVVGITASLQPARRASRTDPLTAIQTE